jgi:hypothetical protein
MAVLTLDLPTDLERRLTDEAAAQGINLQEYALQILFDKLQGRWGPEKMGRVREERERQAQIERNQPAIALLKQWLQEDAPEGPELGPPVEVPPLSLREVRID